MNIKKLPVFTQPREIQITKNFLFKKNGAGLERCEWLRALGAPAEDAGLFQHTHGDLQPPGPPGPGHPVLSSGLTDTRNTCGTHIHAEKHSCPYKNHEFSNGVINILVCGQDFL